MHKKIYMLILIAFCLLTISGCWDRVEIERNAFIIGLGIDLDDNDKRLLYKTFKGNKKMLSALNMKKKEFKIDILNAVEEALLYSYK